MEIKLVERQRKLLSDTKECYMIGMLAEDDGFYPNVGEKQKAITVMKNSTNIAFYVKPLCKEPFPIKEYVNETVSHSDIYVGIDVHQKESAVFPPELKFTTDLLLKEEMIYSRLKDKLIIFSPIVNSSNKSGKEYHFKNMEILKIEDRTSDNLNSFAIIPDINIKNIEFERKLINNEEFVLNNYPHAFEEPEYIKCGNYLYTGFKQFIKDENNKFTWKVENCDDINIIKIELSDRKYKDKIIKIDDNLFFIDEMFLNEKIQRCVEINNIKDSLKIHEELEANAYLNEKECNMLRALHMRLKNKNLLFNFDDIVNFHINIKTNYFTTLLGRSGMGKTSLSMEYANIINATKENKRMKVLQMSQKYKIFHQLMEDLKPFIERASKDLSNIYVVLLEDINYIASKDVLLSLINCENNDIKISENIRIISTVATEDGTSIKKELLDKIGVTTLSEVDFDQLLKIKRNENNFKEYEFEGFKEYKYYIKDSFKFDTYTEREIEFFSELNKLLRNQDIAPISFRTLEKINKSIVNIPRDENNDLMILKEDLIDRVLCDKIISQISGEDIKLEELFGKYDVDTKEVRDSSLIKLISSKEAIEISDFKYTKEVIRKKSKEITLYGYTG